jgi:hypothetical protein
MLGLVFQQRKEATELVEVIQSQKQTHQQDH